MLDTHMHTNLILLSLLLLPSIFLSEDKLPFAGNSRKKWGWSRWEREEYRPGNSNINRIVLFKDKAQASLVMDS